MKRPSPLVQLTMALVALAGTLVILATLFLDVLPDRDVQTRVTRQAVAEALAVQLAERLARDDVASIDKTLRHVVTRTQGLRSIGVRRVGGDLLLDTGGHADRWEVDPGERSRPEQVSVPLTNQDQRWGRIELAFAHNDVHPLRAMLDEPLLKLLLFVTVGGWLVFGLYMRRALQHLDPSSVVPERVQGAFDAMGEGVLVLDTKGRVMMCNKALRTLDPALAEMPLGTRLGSLPWLRGALPEDSTEHPWSRAMSQRSANAGTQIEVGDGDAARRFVVNAAPISDPSGGVRGCLVTIGDTTALHRANEALRETMVQLQASKDEVEHKNAELERLATRDPLTGVMNRRAFQAALVKTQADARRDSRGLAYLMVDIDHFKNVNDTYGHGIGDRVIQEVARRLQDSLRATDLVCRWGGEEFCIVVVGLSLEGACDFAERVRQRIEREAGAAVRETPGLRVTCSIGMVISTDASEAFELLIERADQALYQAKRAGRNRVVAPQASLEGPAVSPRYRDDLVEGCVNATGWSVHVRRQLEAAREADRSVLCMVLVHTAGDVRDRDAPTVLALAARARETLPPRTLVTRMDDGKVAAMVVGTSLDEGRTLANTLIKRTMHEIADDQQARLSIGIDALPARSLGAPMLASRAMQATMRLVRTGRDGVELFSSDGASGGTEGSTHIDTAD